MLTLLRNVDLHAPQPLGVRDVLVAGERVAWIGPPGLTLDGGLGAAVVDLDGRTVVPGLVDGHVHVTGGGGEGGPATMVPPPSVSAFTSVGVTTVVGMLGVDDVVRTPAQVLARVRGLRQEGLNAWMLTGGYHLPAATVTGSIATDLVHVGPVLGVGELAIGDHRGSGLGPQELLGVLAAVRSAALLAGKRGTVHLHVGELGTQVLPWTLERSGQDGFPVGLLHPTHLNRSEAVLAGAAVLPHGMRLDVTAFPDDPTDPAPSAADALLRLHEAGRAWDTLSCSSDAGGSLPVFDADGALTGLGVGSAAGLMDTVRALHDAGVALGDALVPVTTSPAAQLGLTDVGTVAVGASADLVVLDEAYRPTDVMVRGRWHVRDGQQVVRGTFEQGPPA